MNENGSRWHQGAPLFVCQHLHTNAACGLSRKAARSRLKKEGRNPLFDSVQKEKKHLKEVLLDPAMLLMLFSALLVAVFLSPMQTVCAVVVILSLSAAFLRFLYRYGGLSRITAQYRTPTVRVLRDGRVFAISAARVVRGDILLLRAGDIVPGDCRLLTSQQLRVLTLLPNEKGNPTYKECAKRADVTYPQGTQIDAPFAENMLYGGSEILCGEAMAVLVAKGEYSYLGAMHAFTVPTEIPAKRGETPLERLLTPYLRLWGVISLILLLVLTVIGLITKPTGGELTEYFFVLCILIASSSPAVISLYLRWVSLRGCLLCMENDPAKNRAIIKSEAGLEKLASVTDLFVIGKRGLCDGITHFWSAFVNDREIRPEDAEKASLQPLCEAIWLRHEADKRAPIYDSSASVDAENVFLSELTALCQFDSVALKVRLKGVGKDAYPGYSSWQRITAHLHEGTASFLFDSSGTLMRHCLLYADGIRTKVITPEYRSTLRKYCEYVEENGCRTLCIAKEGSEGSLVLLGLIALREQISAVLPSVVEELLQSGVTTRFFLSNDDYARVCRLPEPYLYYDVEHPNLTPALLQRYRTFIGFSKEELSKLLPAYQKSGHRIAVLCGSVDDRCFLRAGVLTLACDTVTNLGQYAEERIEELHEEGDERERSRKTSQAIRRHADVIVERADRFSGGVYAVLQAVSHSRAVEARTRMLLQFLLHSQLARILMMIFAVCTGIGFFASLQMFLVGFAVEILSVFFIADASIAQSALRSQRAVDERFLTNTLFAKKSLLPMVVSALLASLTIIILVFSGVLFNACAQTYLFFSLFLLQICILCRICILEQAKPPIKKALLFGGILLGAILLLTALSILIVPVGSVLGMGAWTALSAILLPIAPALYWILTLLLPFLRRTAK